MNAFLQALLGYDKENLGKLISSKATGDLAKLRKGELDEGAMTKMADPFRTMTAKRELSSNRGDQRTVIVEGSDAKTKKQIVAVKEDGSWKVLSMPKG